MNERIRHWAYFTAQPCALEIPPWKEGRKEGRKEHSFVKNKGRERKGREGKGKRNGVEGGKHCIA